MKTTNESADIELSLSNEERKENLSSLWLGACVICPILGWLVTNFWEHLSEENWQRLYVTRLLFSIGVPMLAGLLFAFFVRWKSKVLALSLILSVTALPAITTYWTALDLYEGKVVVRGVYDSFDYGTSNRCWIEETDSNRIEKQRYQLPCELNLPLRQSMQITLLPNTRQVIKIEK